MIAYLDCEYERGDKVQHRSNSNNKFIVTGFLITKVKDNKVTDYLIECSTGDTITFLLPEEIEHDTTPKLN